MQLVCERDALQRELSRVVGVIESRVAIPILRYVHLDAGAASLVIRGTDLDMEATAPCAADVRSQGVTCVDGKVLLDLVKKCPSGSQIGLTLDESESRLKISMGRSRFNLPTLPPDDFPTLDYDAARDGRDFILAADELRALLGSVLFACSNDEKRYYLNGVYLHQAGEKLTSVATNGHMLSMRAVDLPAQADGMAGVILPRKLVAELLKSLPSDGEIAVEVSSMRVAVTWGDVRIVSNLIDGTFPDYPRVVPERNPHRIVADRKRLIEAVERCSIVLEAKGGSAVNLKIDKDGLELQAQSMSLGKAFDEMDAMVEGADALIGVNYRYLLNVLAACDTNTVEISYSGPWAALLIRPDGDDLDGDAHRMVLMPIRTTEIDQEREAA